MKNLLYGALCFCLIIALGCKKEDDVDIVIEASTPVEISFDQCLTFEAGNFKIKFVELIEESRCPTSVACIWEGVAKVGMEITEDEVVTDIILGTENSMDGDTLLTAPYGDFEIELIDISPYPEDSGTRDESEYKVEFVINEL